MNMVELKTAINFSLMKQVQNVAQVQAATMLEDLAKTQANVQQAAEASHPVLGQVLDIQV